MANVAINLSKASKLFGKSAIMAVCCNTFHSKKIYDDVYLKRVMEYNLANNKPGEPGHITLVSLIQVTIDHCVKQGYKKVGLMCTSGTRQTSIYKDGFEGTGLELVEVPEEDQEHAHDLIYNKEHGIKSLSKANEFVRGEMERHIKGLKSRGAECVILGCTEFPIAIPERELFGIEMVNNIRLMGRKMIELAAPEKLMPDNIKPKL